MKRLKMSAVVIVIAVTVMGIGYANDITGRFGIDGSIGAAMPVGPEWTGDVDNEGMAAGLGLRYGFSKHWSAALSYDDVRIKEKFQLQPISLSAGYMFAPEKRLTPVASLGIGVASIGKSYEFSIASAKAGLGLEYFLNNDWTLSALLNYHFVHAKGTTAFDEEVQALTGGLMLTYFFGSYNDAKEAVSKKTEPVVQQVKEEVKQAVAEVAPAVVPTTSPVEPVAAPVQEITRETKTMQLKVLFDSGKTNIKNEYVGEIDRLGNFLAKYSEASVVIEGHTDATGSEKSNKAISQGRADSIRKYLTDNKGIAAERVKAVGFGSAKPVATNDTIEGRAANRRVMAEFTYQE